MVGVGARRSRAAELLRSRQCDVHPAGPAGDVGAAVSWKAVGVGVVALAVIGGWAPTLGTSAEGRPTLTSTPASRPFGEALGDGLDRTVTAAGDGLGDGIAGAVGSSGVLQGAGVAAGGYGAWRGVQRFREWRATPDATTPPADEPDEPDEAPEPAAEPESSPAPDDEPIPVHGREAWVDAPGGGFGPAPADGWTFRVPGSGVWGR